MPPPLCMCPSHRAPRPTVHQKMLLKTGSHKYIDKGGKLTLLLTAMLTGHKSDWHFRIGPRKARRQLSVFSTHSCTLSVGG